MQVYLHLILQSEKVNSQIIKDYDNNFGNLQDKMLKF